MKILQVVHGFPPYSIGGTENYAYYLSQALAKKHKIFVFSPVGDLRAKEYSLGYLYSQGLENFTINNNLRLCDSFEKTYKNDIIGRKFRAILDKVNPDMVHVQHLLHLATDVVEEAKERDIPVIFTLHDYWLICPQGQLLKNNERPCVKEDNFECVHCIRHQLNIRKNTLKIYYLLSGCMPKYLLRLIKNIYFFYCRMHLKNNNRLNLVNGRISHMKAVFSKIDLFIAPSRFLKMKFIESGIPEDKIAFLPLGLDFDNFKGFKKIPSDTLRFGFIGNLFPGKGSHIAIECFNKIKNAGIELKIYGKNAHSKRSSDTYLYQIRKMVKNKNIKFMGEFNNGKISDIFANMDVLIVPSIWYENSPLVIQEALITGTPVIASRIGGIPELIEDGVNGFLFEPDNADDLYDKVTTIIKNPSLIEKMKQEMRAPKSIEENMKEIEKIYHRFVSGRN